MKPSKFMKSFSYIIFLTFSSMLLAETEHHGIRDIAHVAEKIIFGAEFITRLLSVICIIMGVGLIIMSITYFRTHRSNPKLVPLGKPVMYFILGLAIISIPFLEYWFGGTGNPLTMKKQKTEEVHIHDIDAPLR